jgi:hypothetical protein
MRAHGHVARALGATDRMPVVPTARADREAASAMDAGGNHARGGGRIRAEAPCLIQVLSMWLLLVFSDR